MQGANVITSLRIRYAAAISEFGGDTIQERRHRGVITVFPKFRNPEQPSETWAGRGKKPRWLTAQLRSGKQLDDFRIALAAA